MKSSTVKTKSLLSRNYYVDHSNVIYGKLDMSDLIDSNVVDLFMYLIEEIRFGT